MHWPYCMRIQSGCEVILREVRLIDVTTRQLRNLRPPTARALRAAIPFAAPACATADCLKGYG